MYVVADETSCKEMMKCEEIRGPLPICSSLYRCLRAALASSYAGVYSLYRHGSPEQGFVELCEDVYCINARTNMYNWAKEQNLFFYTDVSALEGFDQEGAEVLDCKSEDAKAAIIAFIESRFFCSCYSCTRHTMDGTAI